MRSISAAEGYANIFSPHGNDIVAEHSSTTLASEAVSALGVMQVESAAEATHFVREKASMTSDLLGLYISGRAVIVSEAWVLRLLGYGVAETRGLEAVVGGDISAYPSLVPIPNPFDFFPPCLSTLPPPLLPASGSGRAEKSSTEEAGSMGPLASALADLAQLRPTMSDLLSSYRFKYVNALTEESLGALVEACGGRKCYHDEQLDQRSYSTSIVVVSSRVHDYDEPEDYFVNSSVRVRKLLPGRSLLRSEAPTQSRSVTS